MQNISIGLIQRPVLWIISCRSKSMEIEPNARPRKCPSTNQTCNAKNLWVKLIPGYHPSAPRSAAWGPGQRRSRQCPGPQAADRGADGWYPGMSFTQRFFALHVWFVLGHFLGRAFGSISILFDRQEIIQRTGLWIKPMDMFCMAGAHLGQGQNN